MKSFKLGGQTPPGSLALQIGRVLQAVAVDEFLHEAKDGKAGKDSDVGARESELLSLMRSTAELFLKATTGQPVE